MDLGSGAKRKEATGDKMSFLQRSPPFQPIIPNQLKNIEKNDC